MIRLNDVKKKNGRNEQKKSDVKRRGEGKPRGLKKKK